ncbi:MAG: type 1 glutamine amidotransferase [Deltaproteobacteria bacterium]|nr:MAG: type 1 glutamine amidotransferase [Deltaproteobacteria bacterium]
MKVTVLQHVPFEGPGLIRKWASERGHNLEEVFLYEDSRLPEAMDLEFLVVMGGPMGAGDEDKYPFLRGEKSLIGESAQRGIPILGICLGAQLIASALGAPVEKNRFREIGWFPVKLTDTGKKEKVFSHLAEEFPAFHWHGDTFHIPDGARHAAFSEGCKNQAFVWGEKVVGLQFHLEMDEDAVEKILTASGKYWKDDEPFVQKPEVIRSLTKIHSSTAASLLFPLLDALAER